jgi:hypothetical protein
VNSSAPAACLPFRLDLRFASDDVDAMALYVSPKTGSDTNDGRTLASAFKTIQRAMQVAQSGDTLAIAPGIYDQDLDKRIGAARAAGIIVTVAGSES